MEPVTVLDLVNFLQVVANAFADVLLLGFSLMLAFSLAIGVKRIFLSGW